MKGDKLESCTCLLEELEDILGILQNMQKDNKMMEICNLLDEAHGKLQAYILKEV